MDKTHTINVLHITSGDLWAGAEVQLFTLVTSLNRQQDININVVLFNHGTLENKLRNENINVIVLDESKLNGLQILRQLICTVRTIQPDIIHTHRSKENILGSIAALFSNIPTIRTSHGAPEHKPVWHHLPKRLILFMDWLCGRFLQKQIIAVSENLAEILQKTFPADRIKVIENGIDLTSISTTNAADSDIKPLSSHCKIGIAGRLVPVKRVDIFIKAAVELMNTHPELNASFHIFGDGPLRTELTALNQELNTGTIIHFEGHCENMQQELADLDILLITSDHEGLPMILLEAMAIKTAVIAHAVGGIPTVLAQGKCGVLVSEQQASAYSDAIYQLIKNPENYKNYIHNAANQVITLYSSEQNAQAYHNLYRDFL